MILKFSLLWIFILGSSLIAQDWKTITTMNDVTDLTFSVDKVWASSTGGIFSFQPEMDEIEKHTNIEGLESILLYAIVADDHNQIIAGGEAGIVEIFDKENSHWNQLYVLEGNTIRDIFYENDSLWIAAGKGLAVFTWNGDGYDFKGFFQNFPIMPNQAISVTRFGQRIWLGTDRGLLSAPADISRYAINNPALWNAYGIGDGLPNMQINAFSEYENKLYIGTPSGLALVDENEEIQLVSNWRKDASLNYVSVEALSTVGGLLYASNTNMLFKYTSSVGAEYLRNFSNAINALSKDDNEILWAGLQGSGIFAENWTDPLRLDGPAINAFRYVYRTSDGKIWGSSGNFDNYIGRGFYVLDNLGWKNYSFNGSGWGQLRNPVSFYEDSFQNMWLGTWGGGLMVIPVDGNPIFFHNFQGDGSMIITSADSIETIPLDESMVYFDYFKGVVTAPWFEVIPVVKENNGRLWIANYYATNDSMLLASVPYTDDGFISLDRSTWAFYGTKDGIVSKEGSISCIEFDTFGRVWIGTREGGAYMIDHKNTFSNKADDVVTNFNVSDNLFSSTVFSIAVDQDGLVWIGSDGGLNSYDGLNVYKHVGDSKGENGPLENKITQIVVDKYNNKWFSTPEGLSILQSDRSPWETNAWKGYTTENSDLVSNNIYSIFVDAATSEALIGTDRGLSLYSGTYAELQDNYSTISGGPNPFVLDKYENPYTLTNLQNHSTVKIFSLNGRLIRTLSTDLLLDNNSPSLAGSRAYWDGKDLHGKLVSSGIYLFAAYTTEGQFTNGKIAVVRK